MQTASKQRGLFAAWLPQNIPGKRLRVWGGRAGREAGAEAPFTGKAPGTGLIYSFSAEAGAGGGDVLSNTSAVEIKQSARRVARRPRDRSKYPRRVPGSSGNNGGIQGAPRGLLTLPMWAFPAGMLRATRPPQLPNPFVSLSPLQAAL